MDATGIARNIGTGPGTPGQSWKEYRKLSMCFFVRRGKAPAQTVSHKVVHIYIYIYV